MKFGIISGSHRKDSQSLKVATFVQKRIKELFPKTKTYLFSLSKNPLPLWDEGVWKASAKWKKYWDPIAKELRTCDAFVIVSPEWHGMVPAGLKNFFLLCTQKEVGHKPALIVTVSAGRGGAYPVCELRQSSYKNNRICYIPEHVIVRDAQNVLNKKIEGKGDTYIRERLDFALSVLERYGEAFKPVRSSKVTEHKKFSNGM